MKTKCKKCGTEQNSELSAGFDFCHNCGEMLTTNNVVEEVNE